jgi:inulin fructotransferase (DFA-I-forming)
LEILIVDDNLNKCISENSYVNNKTGIYVEIANDSFKVTNMGLIYLEHGIIFNMSLGSLCKM